MNSLTVNLGERSYKIIVADSIIEDVGGLLSEFAFSPRCLLVTNEIVGKYYADTVLSSLRKSGFNSLVHQLPDGETAKTIPYAQELWEKAIVHGLDRNSVVIALGGGVVGDVTGFVAATYMRGVPFIQIPTTLLAQVDSSVGGKVAINHSLGKNLIGAFYQPSLVLSDLQTLKTLPQAELLSGLAEVIKYGVIWDAEFFAYLEQHAEALLQGESQSLLQVVLRSCEIKAEVVSRDEKEQDLRAILNFGHTFGHAVETLTGYSKVKHGEAVAMGMVEAARLGVYQGMLPREDYRRIVQLLERVGLPIRVPGYLERDKLLEAMLRDKKNKNGEITLILPRTIGEVEIRKGISIAELSKFWSQEG